MTTLQTLTFWVEFNPATGDVNPWEIFVQTTDGKIVQGGSCKSFEGAEKSIKQRMKARKDFFNCVYKK